MSFVKSTSLLRQARAGGYAVGAFNIENMECALAVVRAAEEARSPVILQTTPSTVRYASPNIFAGMISALAEAAPIPVALHLDHGDSYELGVACIEAGYTSIMIDGSALSYEENVALSSKMVDYASEVDIPVEAELGTVGGKEDDHVADGVNYTDPELAELFVRETRIDALAVAIGTAHGFYQGTPKLDKERLEEIQQRVRVPLVLHGASGVPAEDVQDCIQRGICKVNYATELRVAYTTGVRAALEANPKLFDPKELGRVAMEHVTLAAKERMVLCGCAGKARLFY